MKTTHPAERLVKKKQIAAILGISPRTVDLWINRRWIPVIAPSPRLHLFDPDEVRKAIKARFGIPAKEGL